MAKDEKRYSPIAFFKEWEEWMRGHETGYYALREVVRVQAHDIELIKERLNNIDSLLEKMIKEINDKG